MTKNLRNPTRLGLILGVMASAACSNSGPVTVSDSTAYLAETTVGSINAALINDERSSSVSGGAGNATAHAKTSAIRSLASTSCESLPYTPALGSLTCAGTANGKTVTSVLNCSIAQGIDQLLKGTVTLTFDTASTCGEWLTGIPTSGSVTWTSSQLMRIVAGGAGITTSSDPAKNYKGVSIGGGIETVWSTTAPTTSLNIVGLHVIRQATGNLTVFDHTLTTPEALNVTGTLAAGTREIASGTVLIDHNVQNYTVTGTIANLKWASATCCLPTEGTINFAMSGGTGLGNILVNFATGTCGKVSVADSSVIASKSQPSPSPIPSGLASNYVVVIGGCE